MNEDDMERRRKGQCMEEGTSAAVVGYAGMVLASFYGNCLTQDAKKTRSKRESMARARLAVEIHLPQDVKVC